MRFDLQPLHCQTITLSLTHSDISWCQHKEQQKNSNLYVIGLRLRLLLAIHTNCVFASLQEV